MRYPTRSEVLQRQRLIIEQTTGAGGIINLGLLESALGECRIPFGGHAIHPSPAEKAAALCSSITQDHPLVDGDKRTRAHSDGCLPHPE